MKIGHLILCFAAAASLARAESTNAPSEFDEVYQLLRAHLAGANPAQLDRAAMKGLLEQFRGQASLVEAGGHDHGATSSNALAKTAVYDGCIYLRVGTVEDGLAARVRAAYQDIVKTNKTKIKGVALDLRFAKGTDYKAAAAAADCFLNSTQPLLVWETGSASATTKTNAIPGPLAILVNSETSGAAEALAAALRESNTGLILGETTAGQANTFKEFQLRNGDRLRIATAPIKLGDGSTLARGLTTDIPVDESLADEKIYFTDPYKDLHPSPIVGTNGAVALAPSSARRTLNESELIKEHRNGTEDDTDATPEAPAPQEPATPVINDAALARALDLIKGLAVLQNNKPG